MNFAESLERFRKKFNLSKTDIAKKLNLTPQSIAAYENQGTFPRGDIVIKLATAFGVSTDYLLGLSDNPEPNHAPPASSEEKISSSEKSELDELKSEIAELKNKMARLEKIINF